MAEINELFAQETSPLSDLVVAESYPVNPLPQASVRNRAATTAFLTPDPTKSVENFQTMMMEDQNGQDTTVKAAQKLVQQSVQQNDMKGVMSVLSDPKISVEQKQAVIKGYQEGKFKKDTADVLVAEAIIAPSAGENKEQADVRLTTADMMKEINEERAFTQGLVNAARMGAKEKGYGLIPQALEAMVTPMGQGFSTVAITKQLPGEDNWKSRLQSMFLPGSKTEITREKLMSIPPARRQELSQNLVKAMTSNPDLILSKDSQYEAITNLDNFFGDEYNNTDKWVDNVFNILDFVGLGYAAKTAYKAGKTVKVIDNGAGGTTTVVSQSSQAEDWGNAVADKLRPRKEMDINHPDFVKREPTDGTQTVNDPGTPRSSSAPIPTAQMPEARVGASNQALEALEAKHADLLSRQGTLEPGDIRGLNKEASDLAKQRATLEATPIADRIKALQAEQKITRKEAEKLAKKERQDAVVDLQGRQDAVDNRIRSNAEGSEVDKQLSDLESQIAALRKDTSTQPAKLNPIMEALGRVEKESVARVHNPASPGAILRQTNPQKSRDSFNVLFQSQGDEVAGALFGSSRQDAIADAILPQIATESGRVRSGPVDIERSVRQDMIDNLDDIIADNGGIQFTAEELATARGRIRNDFENAGGMTMNHSMSTFGFDGVRWEMEGVYGTTEGGFINAKQARDQAMYSLKQYGITEDEVEILAKEGLDHVPVKLSDVGDTPGDYYVRVKTRQNLESLKESEFTPLDVKRNMLDFIGRFTPDGWGSLQRWLVDAASMLHPTISGSMVNGIDRSALLEKTMLGYADMFSSAFTKLDKERQTKMFDYIKEANFKNIPQTQLDLMGRGFNQNEINILSDWKNYWDGHFHLENLDVVRSLRRDGYQKFDNGQDELFAKEIDKNRNITEVYDPATGGVRSLTSTEIDDLYNAGGTVAKLRRPASFGADTVEHMIVKNQGRDSLRALRDTDKALNYRDGYFQLTYKAPSFVDEIVRTSKGSISYRRAIAVGGDRKQAELFASRKAAADGKEYVVRGDDRALQAGSDDYFDLNNASGRIAQRHRGKSLEDAAGMNQLGGTEYIDNPVNSAIRAAQSISGRTVMRPIIETAKERFMVQYGDVLKGRNEFDMPTYPKNSSEIGEKGRVGNKRIADARSTYEHIRYMENGYVNAADDAIKATIHALAEGLGDIGLTKAERAIKVGMEGVNPSTKLKGAVFGATIAANPIRQWIVQTHQIVRSMAYNPEGWATLSVPKLMTEYLGQKVMGNKISADGRKFIDFLNGTGLMDAIDKNNLVRNTLVDVAGRGNAITRPLGKVMSGMRKVGFDVGEAGNLIGHSAAVFDKYKRAGKDVATSEVRAQMASEVRAITWDMNFAGDMPYNQNWAAMALQFMQVPHKAVLQITNRRIDPAARLRMVAADMVLWGAPLGITASLLPNDMLPDDPYWKEVVVSGLESAMLNNMFQIIAEDNTRIDFSSLAPYDMSGWQEFFKAAWAEGGMSKIISNSPSGQLLFKDGGRLSNAVKMTMRAFTPTDDGLDTMDKIVDAANEIAKISSGWNNYQKSSAMLVLGQARDRMGKVTDEHVTQFEAIAQILGFGTADTRDFYETSIKLSAMTKDHKEKATQDAKELLQMYQTLNPEDPSAYNRILKISNVILQKYKNDPVAQGIMMKEVNSAMSMPGDSTLKKILAATGLPNIAELPDQVRKSPLDDATKQKVMKVIEDVKQVRISHFKED